MRRDDGQRNHRGAHGEHVPHRAGQRGVEGVEQRIRQASAVGSCVLEPGHQDVGGNRIDQRPRVALDSVKLSRRKRRFDAVGECGVQPRGEAALQDGAQYGQTHGAADQSVELQG